MTTSSHRVMTVVDDRERRVRAAWEKFVAGEDEVHGVPPVILLSWHRSRDLYRVDPLRTCPPPSTGAEDTAASVTDLLARDTVLTELGGIAASLADRLDGSLTTVADSCGRVLGCWGSPEARRRGADSNLAPLFTWSEAGTGTNGMGTALGRERPLSVRGPEHWCVGLHHWWCIGVSVGDFLTGQSVAVLNIAFRGDRAGDPGIVGALEAELERAVAPVRQLLREWAARDGAALVTAFLAAQRTAADEEAVFAVDVGGTVVAANDRACRLAEHLPSAPSVAPRERWRSDAGRLRKVVAEAGVHAVVDPDWTGVSWLDVLRDRTAFETRPVVAAGRFLGVLLVSARTATEAMPECPPPATRNGSRRVLGLRDNRLIILTPGEIRYAEADKHAVWFVTDRGRVRAASRGLDNVERELHPFGFLRVHRGYLVNVHRIQEVEQGACKGTLTVSTHHHGRETIPVARRHVPTLRATLGI